VSRRLAALEKAMGARLFDRKPNGLELTDAGRKVAEAAAGVDQRLAQLADEISGSRDDRARGTVRLTAPNWLAAPFFLPALVELKAAHPELDVQFVGSNRMLNLVKGEADLALRNQRPEQQSLTARKVAELGGCVYASKLYCDRRGKPASRDHLRGHDVLAYEGLGGMPGFEWLRDCETLGAQVAFRANDPEALVSAAAAGLGLAAVPCLLGDRAPALQRIEGLGFARCDMFLVMRTELRTTKRIRVVADFVTDVLERHRAAIAG
jgi:DNA-binding transcriptional LysR family regulator